MSTALLQLFLLLTSENNASVFSSIDRTIKRDILSETANERFVYLEQAATVGALMFKKHFTTACYVTEYIDKLSADFSLAKPGIMASFQVPFHAINPILRCSGQFVHTAIHGQPFNCHKSEAMSFSRATKF